ncbi:MAG: tRNA(m(1)G37)methyltransferase [Candelina submexicana]|nr:MAG: tRNA(m(1)G37)methyltransferase [Candelina submexicana]
MELRQSSPIVESSPNMFRPPINRTMRVLDRSFFRKTLPLSAARVNGNKMISKCRAELERSKDLLRMARIGSVQPDPDTDMASWGRKCLLLKPEVRYEDSSTWSPKLLELVRSNEIALVPFSLDLDYNFWTYHDILTSIMPEEEQEELPSGFNTVGHIAHLNLRSQYLPYKTLIATVLLDKCPTIKTVINKVDDVGSDNEYRTFDYELLAGEPNLNVEVKEQGCFFQFNYSKVYWNSKLDTEHRRIVQLFQVGEAVCDVMAGVGPFAVPAGKKRVFVWANDLNPASYASLKHAIARNKVVNFVKPFNKDGHQFIRSSAASLLETKTNIYLTDKSPRQGTTSTCAAQPTVRKKLVQPRTFAHYILNLPASALSFLPSFVGLYAGQETLFAPHTTANLPMVHVYCFSTKSDTNEEEKIKICAEISQMLRFEITPQTPEVLIWEVRDVAPQKRLFCASFRLPAEVAFRGN